MSFGASSRFTRYGIRTLLLITAVLAPLAGGTASVDQILKESARVHGFAPADRTHVPVDPDLAQLGKALFESKNLSLNGDTSCQDCHLEQFSSGDGIPNAVGIGGQGSGPERMQDGGAIIPRNTLPLWGRGGAGFEVFFWDGKVDFSISPRISQFGEHPPSDDALVTAAHLPVVEIREMLAEDKFIREQKTESVKSAEAVYAAVLDRLRDREPETMRALAQQTGEDVQDLEILDVARAVAHFIRDKFRVKPTKFHQFVFSDGPLSERELRGGLLFYGKGKCAACHSGPYLSDFKFHSIGTAQLGFGKNGFGIDYGRYNVTHDPADLYKFRTSPLLNVAKTGPWGHSGSSATLKGVIVAHFDPLRGVETQNMDPLERHEFYKRLVASAPDLFRIGFLDEEEVDDIIAFLKTLSF